MGMRPRGLRLAHHLSEWSLEIPVLGQGNRTLISFRSKDCIDIAEVKLLAFE